MNPRELGISADVQDFIRRYLRSVEQLDVLALLHRSQPRFWNSLAVASELGIPGQTAEKALDALASNNFLDIKIANDLLYRFNPVTELRPATEAVIEAYRQQRTSMTRFVASIAADPIRDFADAFRLKKEK